MSYCRFAWEGSDVYVYEAQAGLECCGCRLNEHGFCTSEPEEMIKHLALHRRAGHYVPDSAILRLWEDIPGAQRPTNPEPNTLTHASILFTIATLQYEAEKLQKKMNEEKEANDLQNH